MPILRLVLFVVVALTFSLALRADESDKKADDETAQRLNMLLQFIEENDKEAKKQAQLLREKEKERAKQKDLDRIQQAMEHNKFKAQQPPIPPLGFGGMQQMQEPAMDGMLGPLGARRSDTPRRRGQTRSLGQMPSPRMQMQMPQQAPTFPGQQYPGQYPPREEHRLGFSADERPQREIAESNVPEVVQKIDAALAETWSRQNLQPSAEAPATEIVRRAFLDILGRTPTAIELEKYKKLRRPELCSSLVNHEEFPDYWGYLMGQWTRNGADTEFGSEETGTAAGRYLSKKLKDRTFGMDEAARELIAGRFSPQQQREADQFDQLRHQYQQLVGPGGGQVPPQMGIGPQMPEGMADKIEGFEFMSQNRGEPSKDYQTYDMKPATAAIARCFMGVRIECAQCHNNPTSRWTQQDYWSLNASLRGTKPFSYGGLVDTGETPSVTYEPSVFSEESAPQTPNGKMPELTASPGFLDGSPLRATEQTTLREALAQKVLESPYFPRVMVNRIWAAMFGMGLNAPQEPDDFEVNAEGQITNLNHPALMDFLAEEFKKNGYRPRTLVEWICNSAAYGKSSIKNETNANSDTERYFSHYRAKPLSPRQLSMALSTSLGNFVPEGEGRSSPYRAGYESVQSSPYAYLLKQFNYVTALGNPTERSLAVQQVLGMMNSPEITEALWKQPPGNTFPTEESIRNAFQRTLGRDPSPAEVGGMVKLATAAHTAEQTVDLIRTVLFEPNYQSTYNSLQRQISEGTDNRTTALRRRVQDMEKGHETMLAELPALVRRGRAGENVKEEVETLFKKAMGSEYFILNEETFRRFLSTKPNLVDVYWVLLNTPEFNINR